MKKRYESAFDLGVPSTTRLEFLTDGVFAIAMTLLVLEIHVPEHGVENVHQLLEAFHEIWPSFLSFVISFVVLGMFWVAHHTEFRYIKKLDHTLSWLNIFYLMFVSLIPFSAALLGRYAFLQPTLVMYGLHLIILVALHYFIWQHSHRFSLVAENLDRRIHEVVFRMGYFAVGAYLLAIGLTWVDWRLSLLMYAVIPLPYIFGYFYKLR